MTTADAIAQAFAAHTAQSAAALGLHVHRGYATSRLELRNSLTGERIALGERLPSNLIESAAAEALEAIAAERRRLNAECQTPERRGPQTDCARADAVLASVA